MPSRGGVNVRRTKAGAVQPEDIKVVELSVDPTDQALIVSQTRDHNRAASPEPFCGELGRRLLLAELQFSRWVVRRVDLCLPDTGQRDGTATSYLEDR
jgi:hypothetical protein